MRRTGADIERAASADRQPWGPAYSAEEVITALEPLVIPTRRERLQAVLARRIGSVALLLDGIRDPYNGVALLRTCEALGVQDVHLVEHGDPFLVSRRVTQGAHHWLDIHHHPEPGEALLAIRRSNHALVLAHPAGELDPGDLAALERVCIVLGNEHDGVCDAIASACSRSVRVPMVGFAESLNVSVTGGILLAQATRGRLGDLSSEVRRLLYAKALFRTVSRAREVLEAGNVTSGQVRATAARAGSAT